MATLTAGMSGDLPKSLKTANDVGATSDPKGARTQATEELKKAMHSARERLAEASAGRSR